MARGLPSGPLSLTGKQWVLLDCDERERAELVDAAGVSPVTAHLLLNRGISDPRLVREFLEPDLSRLHDPDLLPDIGKAVARVRQALEKREKILVYGDYDADGVTSTALLLQFFGLLGAEASHYIPHRVDEGYGLNLEAVDAAAAEGVGLIVTVDCGTSAVEEVARARELGIDVVITDHHEPPQSVPRALAVVNPKLTGSLYPFRELSGVGVAFKLAWAVAQSFSPGKRVSEEFRRFLLDAIGLVAVGTVADVVPLKGENRIFAVYGLSALRQSQSAGIAALIRQAGVSDRRLTPSDISFKIGPRLNAAGRMAEAGLCVELFMCDSATRAAEIATELDEKNRQRRRIQAGILAEARERLAEVDDWERRRSIVLADEGWHAGVLGIVASKLTEEFYRPTILLSLDEEVGRGSARSVPQFNLFEAIEACGDALLSYGGHRAAAGVKVARGRLEEFQHLFEEEARRRLADWEPCGQVEIDAEVALGAVGRGLIRELARLEPFGQGNRPPVLACSDVVVAGRPRLMGRGGEHVSCYVRQGEGSLRAVGFRMGSIYEEIAAGGVVCDIAFTPKLNSFRGVEEVELELRDIRLRQ